MNIFSKIWPKVKRKWTKLRLQPIRVFCFHQTSEQFDAAMYCKPDWIPLSYLKKNIQDLQSQGYKFISLEDAYSHIKYDVFRLRKYAVLTADDGLKCQLELLPWLEKHHVPITLFVNVETLDGKTCGKPMKEYFCISNPEQEVKCAKELYFTKQDLWNNNSAMLSIGLHGVNHDMVTSLLEDEFKTAVKVCESEISSLKNYIPFYAYTFGIHTWKTDAILHMASVVPVLTDGMKNYNDINYIHREIIEEKYKEIEKNV